ncbi:hypothetical protein ACIPK7_26135 [Pseudomonas sp. NPDC086581]|uniref:hypothetical protein n=1 Tax=Pseudomonas sp. NPDC086581 TaxID=3364432 RepID=UPI003829D031
MFESLRDLLDSLKDEFRRSRGETKPLPLPPKPPAASRPTQPVPSRPNLPPAGPVDSALAPLKNWAHPLGDKSNPLVQLTNLARAVGGYYPLGRNGLWHGGVHFDAGTAGIVGIDQPNVHCLADGEVVAYRIDSRYPFNTFYLADQSPRESPFATGFVLVRHRLQAPAIEGNESAPPALTFYSLYMHLQSWEEYEKSPGQARPVFWKAGTYRVKANVADPGPLGLPVHRTDRPRSDILTVLPRGTVVTINGQRGIVKLTSAQGIDLPRLHASSSTLGYVKFDALEAWEGAYRVRDNAIGETPGVHLNVQADASRASSVIATLPRGTEIVISGEGDYRKLEMIQPAGTGQDSEATNDAPDAEESDAPLPDSPPGPPLEENPWDGTDFKSPRGYVRFSALEPIPAPQQFDRIVIPDSPIPIKAGQLIGHMGSIQEVKDASPHPLLHLEVFSGDRVDAFVQNCRAWALNLPASSRTWLKLAKGTPVIKHQEGFKKATPPTLQSPGTPSGHDLLIPRSLLDGLRSECCIQVPTTNGANALNWYRLEGLLNSANYTPIDGWVCEEVGVTPWVSPWSWEGFELIYNESVPRESLAYSMRAGNEFNEEQLKRYQPLIEMQEKDRLQKRLYDLIPDGDCDGKMSAEELRAGLRLPAIAQAISQLIIHYESEWIDNSGKWDSLDEMLGHNNSTPNFNWVASKERMRMYSWWREVAKSVGLRESGEVYHFHPIGFMGWMEFKKVRVTKEMLKRVFEGLTDSSRKDDLLQGMADELSENSERYKLDTVLRLSHFFAQVRQEVGATLEVEENSFIFSAHYLRQNFKYFIDHPAEANIYGYTNVKASLPLSRKIELANRMYCNKIGNGGVESGDGWKYRGRGLKHLTGKENYRKFQRYHRDFWGQDVGFLEDPDLVHQNPMYVLRSGVFFWLENGLYELADNGGSPVNVDSITERVNLHTDSYGDRRKNFKRIFADEAIFSDI